ncbi:hypothetical protein HMPREF1318_2627 [Actinomyces massiliensis F0489]|uniref:Uncharacterized protein n=1 Tax=Actinomyces massiliensis F0489 TaxID=1125718 RepID=J1HLH6_9ACTO|nr:hypothetical protein HMPREF1318_2627 [Actinomyces massiliensis F0489]
MSASRIPVGWDRLFDGAADFSSVPPVGLEPTTFGQHQRPRMRQAPVTDLLSWRGVEAI